MPEIETVLRKPAQPMHNLSRQPVSHTIVILRPLDLASSELADFRPGLKQDIVRHALGNLIAKNKSGAELVTTCLTGPGDECPASRGSQINISKF